MHTDSELINLNRIVTVSRDPEVQHLAHKCGREVFGADDPVDALEVIKKVSPNLILFDQRFNADFVREFIDKADKNSIDIPVVLVADSNCDENTFDAEYDGLGIFDYLRGMQDYDKLQEIIGRINNKDEEKKIEPLCNEKDENRFFVNDFAVTVSMAGKSKAITDILETTRLVASSRCNPILILGETGTGKELVSKAIHILRNPNEQFVAVNCAAIADHLLESELFGHVKGSFTGADYDKTGFLELAGSGTILLDEISEMPLNLQAKLLRVLEEKKFRKVGGTKFIDCKATIIAASNRNLKQEVQEKNFRRDLYYRLNISPIILAPLRSPERMDDIPLLADYFLKTTAICPEKIGKITSLTKLAVEALGRHGWPGNVRELRNIIDRAVIFEKTDKIGLNGIVFDAAENCEVQQTNKNDPVTDFSLAKAECELISRALQQTGWQKTRAAALLGITRATLYAKVKQYNIEKDTPDSVNNNQKQENLAESLPFA